jgi:hypothetical protein
MKNFITMLLAITLVACATARQVYVPTEGYAMDVSESVCERKSTPTGWSLKEP